MTNSNDAVDVMAGILRVVASGEIKPDEPNGFLALSQLIARHLELMNLKTELSLWRKG